MFIQLQVVVIVSAPSFRKMNRGRRLTINANFTAVLTWVRAHSSFRGLGVKVESTG